MNKKPIMQLNAVTVNQLIAKLQCLPPEARAMRFMGGCYNFPASNLSDATRLDEVEWDEVRTFVSDEDYVEENAMYLFREGNMIGLGSNFAEKLISALTLRIVHLQSLVEKMPSAMREAEEDRMSQLLAEDILGSMHNKQQPL